MDPLDILRGQIDPELENLVSTVVFTTNDQQSIAVPSELTSKVHLKDDGLVPITSKDGLLHSAFLACLLHQQPLIVHQQRTHYSPGYVVLPPPPLLSSSSTLNGGTDALDSAFDRGNECCLLFCHNGHLMYVTRKKPAGSVCFWCGWKLNTPLSNSAAPPLAAHSNHESMSQPNKKAAPTGGGVGWCPLCKEYICGACKSELRPVTIKGHWCEGSPMIHHQGTSLVEAIPL